MSSPSREDEDTLFYLKLPNPPPQGPSHHIYMPWTKCGPSFTPGHQVLILIAFYTMLGYSGAIRIPVYCLG
jgi:hypothetical protein